MAAPVEPVWRCTRCGGYAAPDPMMTQLDPRYATGRCPYCQASRVLVKTRTVEEATAGYHALLEAQARKKASQIREAKDER